MSINKVVLPAYAGMIPGCSRYTAFRESAPRICGDDPSTSITNTFQVLCSPHMRGAQYLESIGYRCAGIIPAYAGSTFSKSRVSATTRDHPRICGEHDLVDAHPCTSVGSSPHMQGALQRPGLDGEGAGIIPAYAGSTWSRRSRPSRTRDHPRICGEHPSTPFTRPCTMGSSPHMRGALAL